MILPSSVLRRSSTVIRLAGVWFAAIAALANLGWADHSPRYELRNDHGELHLYIEDDGHWVFYGAVRRIRAGTRLFHWTNRDRAHEWSARGSVDPAMLEAWMHNLTDLSGGGFYVSLSPVDSSDFGDVPVVLIAPYDLLVLNYRAPSFERESHARPDYAAEVRMRAAGVHAIQGIHPTWLNVIAPSALTSLHLGTADDLYAAAHDSGLPLALRDLNAFDRKVGVTDSPRLDAFPIWAKIVRGKTLTHREQKSFVEALRSENAAYAEEGNRESAFVEDNAPATSLFGKRLRDALRSEVLREARARLQAAAHPIPRARRSAVSSPLSDLSESIIADALAWGAKASELVTNISPIWDREREPPPAPYSDQFWLFPASDPSALELAKNLLHAFEIVDYDDLMSAIANGHPAPWTVYDEPGRRPFLLRWRDATERPIDSTARLRDSLIETHRIISDISSGDFRDTQMRAGGAIYLPHDPAWGYYSIHARDLEVLESNPFLEVDARPDPRDSSQRLVRYRYPSAETYARFARYLKPSLVRALDRASKAGELRDDRHPTYRRLTRAIVENLIEQVAASPSSALRRYQLLMAIHPFPDYNGRTLRAWLKRMRPSQPFFLRSYEHDLSLTHPEIAVADIFGRDQLARISDALVRAVRFGARPGDLVRLPELWLPSIEADRVAPADRARFVELMAAWYRDGANRVVLAQKRVYEIARALRDACARGLIGMRPAR